MLRPYVYVVCEKVIIDKQQEGVASLIALFSKIVATVFSSVCQKFLQMLLSQKSGQFFSPGL